ncbi:CRISPR-associated ring nuclease Csm6 [Microbulbifer thermotolerans]|nr:CRISPR-associated ring nuclease Csm6 [Microbulbifer thermotolerans]MCX2796429.1 CRISPR-associated ring nuclease Csm6 [Microbulbifer thermotolerans]
MEPKNCKRRILLAVSGMSPQILTETLYALACVQRPAFIPTEIHLLTTASGARSARHKLLHGGNFVRLCKEYGLDPELFKEQNIHLLCDAQGQPLEDIRTARENEIAADQIVDWVRRFTSDPCAALHLSLAGGRKTMGYFAGYALSLFGRAQDRLSHVLVSSGYESHPEFFFPTRESHLIEVGNGRVLDARDARVELADIPFVRLRTEIPQPLLEGGAGFSETIRHIQRIDEPPRLELDLTCRQLRASGLAVELPPMLFAFYAWIVQRHLRDDSRPCAADLREPNGLFADELMTLVRSVEGEMGRDRELTERSLKNGMDKAYFEEKKSRVNKILESQLGKALARNYQITRFGKRPNTSYGLALEKENIDWRD